VGCAHWHCRRWSLYATGDKFAVAADAYLSNHADEWSKRHGTDLKALMRMHAGGLADVPVNRITTEQITDTLRPIWNGPGNRQGVFRYANLALTHM
jgi:Phage integrase central domain